MEAHGGARTRGRAPDACARAMCRTTRAQGGHDRWRIIAVACGGRHSMVLAMPCRQVDAARGADQGSRAGSLLQVRAFPRERSEGGIVARKMCATPRSAPPCRRAAGRQHVHVNFSVGPASTMH
jgi:hypothetical protein